MDPITHAARNLAIDTDMSVSVSHASLLTLTERNTHRPQKWDYRVSNELVDAVFNPQRLRDTRVKENEGKPLIQMIPIVKINVSHNTVLGFDSIFRINEGKGNVAMRNLVESLAKQRDNLIRAGLTVQFETDADPNSGDSYGKYSKEEKNELKLFIKAINELNLPVVTSQYGDDSE